jgi:hypothetical protein
VTTIILFNKVIRLIKGKIQNIASMNEFDLFDLLKEVTGAKKFEIKK